MPETMPGSGTSVTSVTISPAGSVPRSMPERWGRWLFDRPFLRVPDLLWERAVGGVLPVDEFVEDGTIVVRAELAGVDPDKGLEVEVADDILRISAQRHDDDEFARRSYLHRELGRGSVRRVLPVPSGTEAQDVRAVYRDGVLEVRVPVVAAGKAEPARVVVERT
jgi:HSP20 family protein